MEETVPCPACGANVSLGKEFCTACGGAMSPISRPAASAQTAQEMPKPAIDTTAPALVPTPAANSNNSDKSWVKRHKGLSIILAIAVVGGGISIISNLSNSDSSQSSGTVNGVAAVVSCSPETLQTLTNDLIDLNQSTQSATAAIIDGVLTPAAGVRRIKTRFARETAQEQKIHRECVSVSDSDSGAALLASISELEVSSSVLYTYFEAFLDSKTGTQKGFNQRADTVSSAIKNFNTAWAAFGDEQGFTINNDPVNTVDESQVAD